MSVIDEMSRLVLADPNVTAKQIAKHLGYAEEKSVYYWLRKSGFVGVKDFKKSVLTRITPKPVLRRQPGIVKDIPTGGIALFNDAGSEMNTAFHEHISSMLSHGSYGVVVGRTNCGSLASAGDILIIDPGAPSFQGDIMWASVRGKMQLIRQYGKADGLFYVDAGQPEIVLSPDFVSGKVAFIVRKCT